MLLRFRQNYGRRLPVGWYRRHVRPHVLRADAIGDRWHRKFDRGLRAAWYRDHVRPRILRTAPVKGTVDSAAEVHVLTSARDWLNLVWTLKTFYHYSRRQYRLCIHEDGSVPPDGLAALRHHFPHARLISRSDADARLVSDLAPYPRALKFRQTNQLAPKIFDFAAYLEADRMLLFDSDLLFFGNPVELIRRVEDPGCQCNTFNADCCDAYVVNGRHVREQLGFELHPWINSGLGLVHRHSIRWDWIEQFLALPGILDGHPWRIEQQLFALCSSRFGVELLPSEYTLHLDPGINGSPFRHYVGGIRHLMYSEGIRQLCRQGFLKA